MEDYKVIYKSTTEFLQFLNKKESQKKLEKDYIYKRPVEIYDLKNS